MLFSPSDLSGLADKFHEQRYGFKLFSDISCGFAHKNLLAVFSVGIGKGPFHMLIFFLGGTWLFNSKDSFLYVWAYSKKNGSKFF